MSRRDSGQFIGAAALDVARADHDVVRFMPASRAGR